MSFQKIGSAPCEVKRRRRVVEETKHEGGVRHSVSYEPDGTEEAEVEVWVDVAKLVFHRGDRAIFSARNLATVAGGAVRLVATNRKRRKGNGG